HAWQFERFGIATGAAGGSAYRGDIWQALQHLHESLAAAHCPTADYTDHRLGIRLLARLQHAVVNRAEVIMPGTVAVLALRIHRVLAAEFTSNFPSEQFIAPVGFPQIDEEARHVVMRPDELGCLSHRILVRFALPGQDEHAKSVNFRY